MKDFKNSETPEWVTSLLDYPLDLPDGNDFVSISFKIAAPEMVAISERYLPTMNSRPDFVEAKMKRVFPEPFEL